MNIVDKLNSLLLQALKDTYKENYSELDEEFIQSLCFEAGNNPEHGDFSSSFALKLSKYFKKNPIEIAESVKDNFSNKLIGKVDVIMPGFLNVFLSTETKANLLKEVIDNPQSYGKQKPLKQSVLIEFVSSNPTGPLHVGHGRGAVLGSSLASLFENAGYEVTTEYYVNDAGRQISILTASVLLNAYCESFISDGTYEGAYIKKLAEAFRNSNEIISISLESIKSDEDKDKRLDSIISFLSLEFPNHWAKAKEFSVNEIIELIKEDLGRFGVVHDEWFFESSVGRIDEKGSHLNNGLASIAERGLTFQKDGAIWFKTTEFGDDKDRVLVRDNGEPTYFMTDIAYHKNKIDRKYNLCINIFGADHHGYVTRISSAFNALKTKEQKIEVLLYQLVNLFENGKQKQMSTRRGEFYSLEDLQTELGADAIKFFFLEKKSDHTMEFDINKAKEANKNNPYFYTQYAHVRCASILEKGSLGNKLEILEEDIQNNFSLVSNLIHFPLFLKKFTEERSPHSLVHYLKEVSSQYHSFYENYSVLSDNETVTNSRLALTQATQIVLNRGLSLLGVKPLMKM